MKKKKKNNIIEPVGDDFLKIDKKDVARYLSEVKDAVRNGRYRLDRNSKRQDNINLFLDYVIDETKAKNVILSLIFRDSAE